MTEPTGLPETHIQALRQFLERQADELAQATRAQGVAANEPDGLLFLGEWNESYPGILVRDPFLTQSAKVQFLYLMQESKSNSRQAFSMPSAGDIAAVIGQSRKTVTRDRLLLRLTRWISLFRQVRDNRGRFRGGIYAIHSEPAPLNDATHLDANYMASVHDATHHEDAMIRHAAAAVLGGIGARIADGEDPTASPDRMGRRVNAQNALRGNGTNFFDLQMGSSRKMNGHRVATAGSGSNVATFAHRPAHQLSGRRVANLDSGTNATKLTHGRPCVNSTHGRPGPCVEFTRGIQDTDNKEKSEYHSQNAESTHGTYCSSSFTTTTNSPVRAGARANADNSAQPASHAKADLRWPTAFDANQQELIYQALVRREIEPSSYQSVVDVLAHKAADPNNPLRSPVAYAVKLCERLHNGTFQPIGTPTTRSNGHSSPNSRSNARDAPSPHESAVRTLRGEIRALEAELTGLESNLIDLVPAEQKPSLETFRDRLKQQIDDKRAEYRRLKAQSAHG